MAQIADTGFLVAYWNKRDMHNSWARGLAVEVPLITCAPVLTEAGYLLGNYAPLLRMLERGDLVLTFDIVGNVRALLDWVEKYSNLKPDLADACVVALAELNPNAEILTTDRRDFSIYRTFSGQALRCIFPPES